MIFRRTKVALAACLAGAIFTGCSSTNSDVAAEQGVVTIVSTTLPPGAPTSSPLPIRPKTQLYIVKAGDTLASIADSYATTVTDLKRFARIPDDNLQVGQQIRVPVPASAAAPSTTAMPSSQPTPTTATTTATNTVVITTSSTGASISTSGWQSYLVKPGETLEVVARNFGTTASDLARANQLTNPNQLAAGAKILVPPGSSGGSATAGLVHIVAIGETLDSIAAAYGVTSAQIVKASGLANPNNLSIGQRLTIPQSG